MRNFKNLPIKYKLFITYGMLAVVIFSVGFALFYFQVRNEIEQRIKSELNKSNQTVTDMVETAATVSIKNYLRAIAEKNREILFQIYGQYQNGRLTEAAAKERAVALLLAQTVGSTGYIYCIDSNGTAVVHPNEKIRGENFSHRQFIHRQIERKNGYLEYMWKNPGETAERPKALYMAYFQPWDWIISVSSYKSEFAKLISVSDFKYRILGLTFGETGYSFIIDTSGNAIVHPELSGNFIDIQDARGFPIMREMIKQKRGYLTYLWKNPSETVAREKFVAFDYIPDFNWIIASSSYTSEVYAPLDIMKKSFHWILVLSVLVIGIVTLLVSASITRPLTAFIRIFENGAREGWTQRMDESRKDEFGKFSTSLNLFMAELDAKRKELVTEIGVRKQAEKELSILRNYLENIINSMPSVLIATDGQGTVTLWNRQAERLSGVKMSQARGKPLAELLPRVSRLVESAVGGPDGGDISYFPKNRFLAPGGRESYEDITVYRLKDAAFDGAVIRVDDASERVRMEEMLIQSEKMLSIGGLAAGMAHEINNPLAGMIQTASLMKMRLQRFDLPANLSTAQAIGIRMPDIRAYMEKRNIFGMLDAINDSGLRIADIVENMLSFARQSDAIIEQHDPAQLLDQTLELAATDYDLKKHHDFKTIRIRKAYAHPLPMVPCEKAKIQQVLLNILRNGAQAMHSSRNDGTADPCFIIRLSVEEADNMLRIEISDNGPGMDKKTQKRIFDPFFSTKAPGVGTGLGLSVSYFIITENHGGTLDVFSLPGQGATFTIRLPLSPARLGADQPPDAV